MALARTHSVALVGVQGHVIEVEADITSGLPWTVVVGLPDTSLREAKDRIRAAITNSGEEWPHQKITVGLSPASLPKRGSGFDVAIAVGVLAAAGALPLAALDGTMFLAELGLDGRLRPVPGVLPAVAAAAGAGLGTMVVAAENAAEAALVPGVRVVPAASVAALAAWLRGGPVPETDPSTARKPGTVGLVPHRPPADLAEVLGQAEARRAAEVCAAGGHNLSLLGPPGAGKTMLAERLPTILPRLEPAAALEVTSIHSVAGTLTPETGLVTEPPFCAPHHTASKAAIVGGGSGIIRPGAASLAHLGILFLDEAPEFARDVLDALRQPLESGEVVIARSAMCARFPARFTLVLASNPCPCAKAASSRAGCDCSPAARRRYLSRLSGPLLDRVDVKVELQPVSRSEMLYDRKLAEPSTVVAERVAAARARAAHRLRGTPWRLNAEVPGAQLRRSFAPAPGALATLDRAMELGRVSARGADKIVRVAWSLADLAGRNRPTADDCNSALGLWLGISR
ncbi:MAG: YifB family Mg chelatase-like AAA ATPase [Streptosporangiaceae bacterium]|nr:YifB family Mg chelatase-like AAA ATPase [Streptosporangiaceae bacterium]MBV9856033.1 YifB family Mg chelatase-like AAA ATPase [Streptosporangiaceae bacterium]